MSKVTVGVPVFNEGKYLPKTLESLINQEFTDWKAVISDNCSDDNTWEIINKYADRDDRITGYRHEEKKPTLENFHYTLLRAETEFFVWLGGHDLFDKRYLKAAIVALENTPDAAMVYPKSIFIDTEDKVLGHADSDIQSNGLNRRDRMCKIARNLSSCSAIHGVFRRALLANSPFKKVVGPDHLILFSVSAYGKFIELPFVGIQRRKTRDESYTEAQKRWEKEKIFSASKRYKPHGELLVEHLKFIITFRQLHLAEKIYLLLNLQRIFKKRFSVNVRDIFFVLFICRGLTKRLSLVRE